MHNRLTLSLGLFFTSVTMLMVEILLIRVFDVLLLPNTGYLVITLAMFAFGVAGIYATLRPIPKDQDVHRHLAVLTIVLALSILLVQPGFNSTHFIYDRFESRLVKGLIDVTLMYIMIMPIFFLGGLIVTYVFSAYPLGIRSLYFWDLAGAALGCVIFMPFLPRLGPAGLMVCAAAVLLIASGLFAGKTKWSLLTAIAAAGLFVLPFVNGNERFEFDFHLGKRGVRAAQRNGQIELSAWDPISKIDVVNIGSAKHVAYDGGSQSSLFFPFDGNYERLGQIVLQGSGPIQNHFSNRGVLASHYLKRNSGAEVLIFGSAAGQETKAALLFSPSRVDGIELVETVVRIGKESYAQYTGNIFNDPRVNNRAGEGRSYLRSTDKKYDIIQIFSNHTSSNIAIGSGAVTPVYLQTVEAYREYFEHLKDDGLLHINHHFYPRMVTTAAQAWSEMSRRNFQKHVVVYEREGGDTLATMLIKMSPWTRQEIENIDRFFGVSDGQSQPERIVVNPLDPDKSFLSSEFFSGRFPAELQSRLDYKAMPTSDDSPYFNNIQNGFRQVTQDPHLFLNEALVQSVNGRLGLPLGEYTHFAALGGVGLLLSVLFIFVPLFWSRAGQERWPGKYVALGYFSCLGLGFIVIELVLIQIFMKVVGFPLYTFSTVIFTMLFGAGLGSLAARRFRIDPENRWIIPFVGVFTSGISLWSFYPNLSAILLAASTPGRIIATIVMIFPLAFFLGMPFPLGILSLEKQPRGAIAWAWAANSLFTVIGGIAAGVLSMFLGFRLTLLVAFGTYLLAFLLFSKLRSAVRVNEPLMALRVEEAALAASLSGVQRKSVQPRGVR
jgi:spermidine synthase